jgi:monoamine oxidase
LLDQALTEMMIDYSDFQASETVHWQRVQGISDDSDQVPTGMSALTDTMRHYIIDNRGPDVTKDTPVVKMSQNTDGTIRVTFNSTTIQRPWADYKHVICTTALGCLQRMDLSGLNLSDDLLMGIRTLSYDRATKVAIKCE